MIYDQDNDKLVSKNKQVQIYPDGHDFPSSQGISIEEGGTVVNYINIKVDDIDSLIKGLTMAKEMMTQ